MLDPDDTCQDDLRGGSSPWLAGPARPASQELDADIRCDVVIVGGDITGALAAEHLTARSHDVVLVDREREGFGSTAASTAMLQWEIDLPLIGRVPGQPRMLAAYGYGGNGITFSFLASRIIGALIAGAEASWFGHFAIDRPDPARI